MNRRVIVILLGLACLLSGCAGKYYYQEGKTLDQCREDSGQCMAELSKYKDAKAEDAPARYNIAYDYEGEFLDTCMKDKGYEIVFEHKLPLKVKRKKPDPWNLYDRGLAGTINDN